MEIGELENALKSLIEVKNKLLGIDYNDEAYDTLEEQLHDAEDDFLSNYGDYLEDAFHEVHDEYCPDSEVLLPIAYLASKYTLANGKYEVASDQGVYVEMDDFPGQETKLVLAIDPLRIILNIDGKTSQVVWQTS